MVEVERESLFSVVVGDKTYYDESNGIMNFLMPIHRVTVPTSELDRAGEYSKTKSILSEQYGSLCKWIP